MAGPLSPRLLSQCTSGRLCAFVRRGAFLFIIFFFFFAAWISTRRIVFGAAVASVAQKTQRARLENGNIGPRVVIEATSRARGSRASVMVTVTVRVTVMVAAARDFR